MSDYTPFPDALRLMADRLSLDAETLLDYASEAPDIGGDVTPNTAMCIDQREGAFLYALVRALRPARVVEVGVSAGISAVHLLSALAANGEGVLTSYDIDPGAGTLVPDALRGRWDLRIEDALSVDLPVAEVVFEDAAHTLDFSLALYRKLRERNPRVVIVHDYHTSEVYDYFYVQPAFDTVFPDGLNIKIKDSFRGFGVWVNPDWHAEEMVTEPVAEVAKPAPVKRTAKPRAKKAAARK